MFNNYRWLEIAEYLSLAGSVAGMLVAAITGQILYVAIPLSACVLLNSIARRRDEIQSKLNTNAAMTRVQRQLSGELQSFYDSVRNFPPAPVSRPEFGGDALKNGKAVSPSVETQEFVISLVKNNLSPIYHDLVELKDRFASLQDSLTSVVQYLNSSSLSNRVENLEKAIAKISPDPANVANQVDASLQNQLDEIKYQLQQIYVEKSSEEIRESATSAELSQLQSWVEQQLNLLNHQLEEIQLATSATKQVKMAEQDSKIVGEKVSHSPQLPFINLNPPASPQNRAEATSPGSPVPPKIVAEAQHPSSPPTSPKVGSEKRIEEPPISSPQPPITESVADSWTCVHKLEAHSDWVASIVVSGDGQKIFTGSFDGKIKIWDLRGGQLIRQVSENAGVVYAIALSPLSEIIASGSSDLTVKLWDTETGALLDTFREHCGSIRSVAISPDGRTLASGSFDQTIKIFSLETGKYITTLSGHLGAVSAIAFSPDGQILASGAGDGNIKFWHWNTGQLLHTFSGDLGFIGAIAFHPDGFLLASASTDRTIKLWDLATRKKIGIFTDHAGAVTSAIFSPDRKTLISGSADGTIKIWHLETGKLLCTLGEQSSVSVVSVALSPDGKNLIGGSVDGTINIWQKN